MTNHAHEESLLIGIDVAKATLDVARSDRDQVATFANDEAGIKALIQSHKADRPALIVVEATGGLEAALIDALLEADLPVARVNPGHVRHLAKGLGILAKTDSIDARACWWPSRATPSRG